MFKPIGIAIAMVVSAGAAHAEKIDKLVSELTKEEKVFLQRAFPYDQAACASEEIDFLTSTGTAKTVRISFDDEDGGDIAFKFKDGFVRLCGPEFMTEISGKERIELDY